MLKKVQHGVQHGDDLRELIGAVNDSPISCRVKGNAMDTDIQQHEGALLGELGVYPLKCAATIKQMQGPHMMARRAAHLYYESNISPSVAKSIAALAYGEVNQ